MEWIPLVAGQRSTGVPGDTPPACQCTGKPPAWPVENFNRPWCLFAIVVLIGLPPLVGCSSVHNLANRLTRLEYKLAPLTAAGREIRRLPPVVDTLNATSRSLVTRPHLVAHGEAGVARVSHEERGATVRLAGVLQSSGLEQAADFVETPLEDVVGQSAPGSSHAHVYPIDLANALALGGANNLQIQLARQRLIEANAKWDRASLMLLPSLRFGFGYTKHDGRLQETEGNVIEVSRNSLFVGGGAGLGAVPLAGGAGGPMRLMVNLSLADAAFEPLVARQWVDAARAAETATVNDSHLAIAVAYFNLIEAHSRQANAQQAASSVDEIYELTKLFADAGQGSEADVYRVRTERAYWQRQSEDALRRMDTSVAELRRLLRLSPNVDIRPVDEYVVPVDMVNESDTSSLVETALTSRPELAHDQAVVCAMLTRLRQEKFRPWLPYVQVGASGGTFGGGTGSERTNEGGRSDADLLAVWELENLGLGNRALRNIRSSQVRQAEIQAAATVDRIVSQVESAAASVNSYRLQIETARHGLTSAEQSYRSNLVRIKENEGLPLEIIQAIRARHEAQDGLALAISDYNRAQFHLLRAIGQPPST